MNCISVYTSTKPRVEDSIVLYKSSLVDDKACCHPMRCVWFQKDDEDSSDEDDDDSSDNDSSEEDSDDEQMTDAQKKREAVLKRLEVTNSVDMLNF